MKKIMIVCLMMIAICIGCTDKPDLVPVEQKVGYCEVNDSGLVVTVQNQGNAESIESVTRVEFGGLGSRELVTPSLAPGQLIKLSVPIPVGCFNPDCSYKISVDIYDIVTESSEDNNQVLGNCIG